MLTHIFATNYFLITNDLVTPLLQENVSHGREWLTALSIQSTPQTIHSLEVN